MKLQRYRLANETTFIPDRIGIACMAGDVAELESELAATLAERNELRMGCPPTYEAALDKARGQLHRLRHVLLQRLHECGDFAEFDGTKRICNVCQQELPEDMETQLAAANSANEVLRSALLKAESWVRGHTPLSKVDYAQKLRMLLEIKSLTPAAAPSVTSGEGGGL